MKQEEFRRQLRKFLIGSKDRFIINDPNFSFDECAINIIINDIKNLRGLKHIQKISFKKNIIPKDDKNIIFYDVLYYNHLYYTGKYCTEFK